MDLNIYLCRLRLCEEIFLTKFCYMNTEFFDAFSQGDCAKHLMRNILQCYTLRHSQNGRQSLIQPTVSMIG